MSTITEATSLIAPSYQPPPGLPSAITTEQRIVIRNVTWELYNRLSDEIGERQHVYLAYDGNDLEIMTKGREHEDFKEFLGRFVNALAFELKIRCRGAGETTWKRPEIMRGLEVDLFRLVAQEDTNDELAWEARLREWARTELASRLRESDV
jgi:Uma2 family endonuclease